jgi:tetratricopeptide (TPR) repeat protein
MSYINDALKKAQKEKDTQKYHCRPIVAGVPEKRFRIGSRYIFAFLIILIIASTAITFYWMWQQQPSPNKHLVKPATVFPQAVVKNEIPIVPPESGKAESKPVTPSPVKTELKPVTLPPGKMAMEQERLAKAAQPSNASLQTKAIVKERAEAKRREVTKQKDVEILYREALASQNRQDLSTAERLYKNVLNLDPKYVKAINNIGVIYMQQNKRGHAIQMFDRAISIKKDYVDPYYNMACLYAQFSDLSGSMKYLQSAANINPEAKKWAKSDRDLKNINTSPEFLKFIGGVDGKEQ